MNRNDNLPPRWHELVARARPDRPPGRPAAALIGAVRDEWAGRPASQGWWPEFSLMFGSRRMLAGVASGALALSLLLAWQAATSWSETIPWVQMLAGDETVWNGGAL